MAFSIIPGSQTVHAQARHLEALALRLNESRSEGLSRHSYIHSYQTSLGVMASCLVTRILMDGQAFMVLTDPENDYGPALSANFAIVASDLKSADAALRELSPASVHWLEYRGPGSYIGGDSASFLLVIMNFNEALQKYVRPSWGHVSSLMHILHGNNSQEGAAWTH